MPRWLPLAPPFEAVVWEPPSPARSQKGQYYLIDADGEYRVLENGCVVISVFYHHNHFLLVLQPAMRNQLIYWGLGKMLETRLSFYKHDTAA